MPRRFNWHKASIAIIALAAYVWTTQFVFAMRHPDLTNTQLFLYFWDALLWREVA